ncbi:MAG: efflux RND transporter periplasmic adaptor subunit [Gammaproteobacteria bacterium]|nr:efflux RND transporter periplasmic adaptor subunit [Gammaproteobacteria bacterium]MYK46058.1 efflux RND transporter periplasmic adaptor subunit [Gammaproteobacteria bacterium]
MIRRLLAPVLAGVAGLALAAVILMSGPELDPQPPAPTIPAVRTVAASPGTVQMTVAAHGAVVPRTESNLVSEVAGRVVSVAQSMVSGGFFERGDVLVEIERADYEVALERFRAQATSAESELARAEKAYQRHDELREAQSISESLHDEALNRLTIARASLREARARVARGELDLARTRMTAPFDGRVRSERVDPGQFVNRGESIATLYSVDVAEVRLPVRDEDLAFLPSSVARLEANASDLPRVVLKARFAGAEHAWEARIVRTEGELDPRTRMVNLVAQVPRPYDPADDSPPLTVGLFVEAEIYGKTIDDVLVVPRSALQSGEGVFVVDSENRLSFRDVEILRSTGEVYYVRGAILAGEPICLSTLDGAADGQRVRPVGT